MKIKMTFTDRPKRLFAGLVYDLPDKDAQEYLKQDKAILAAEEPEKEQHGNGKNKP